MKFSVSIRIACASLTFASVLAVAVPVWCRYVRTRDVHEGIPLRQKFVAAYGLYRRVTGARSCNGCVKLLESDQLMLPSGIRRDMAQTAQKAIAFSEFCRSNGVRYLYVQLPKKLDVRKTMLPPGVRDFAYENADDLLRRLEEAGVIAEDWRPRFAGSARQVEDNFYVSDTHWNNPASLRAAHDLACAIARLCDADAVAAAEADRLLQSENWTCRQVALRIPGALAKRTGRFFSAPSDVMALWPKFKTELTVALPERKSASSGSFLEVAVSPYGRAMSAKKALEMSFSRQYAGADERLVRLVNCRAPLDRKVMLLGDSFSRSLRIYLWVAVREIVAVDLRHWDPPLDVARLVLDERPDIVIQIPTAAALLSGVIAGENRLAPP